MKLKPTHFYDPEPKRPLDMYYKPDFGCQKYPQETFESDLEDWGKAHSAWKARQRKPGEQNCCMVFCADYQGNAIRYNGECYQKALQHYEENRRRWDDFEDHTPSDWDDGDNFIDMEYLEYFGYLMLQARLDSINQKK